MLQTLVYVEGRKGSGKSTLLRTLALAHAREGVQFFVWDSTREWQDRPGIHVYPALVSDPEKVAALAIREQGVLVMDEIDRVATKHANLAGEFPRLHSIIHYGRHLNAALLCAARRPASVHTDVLSLADVFFLFAHSGHTDCAWVETMLGREVAEQVKSLSPGEFVRVDY